MSEKFVLFLWELSLLSKNHQSHFSSQGPFYLFATATPKSHLLKGCLEAHAFECFSMPKVEPRFIEEMKVVMPYLPNLGLGDPYVKEDEWPAEFFFFLSLSAWTPIYFFFPFLYGIKIVERDINQKKVFFLNTSLAYYL